METLCRAPGQDCRLISHCPAVLKLVFKKVKAGDPGARQELLQSQCGFEKSLPKVCCGGAGWDLSPGGCTSSRHGCAPRETVGLTVVQGTVGVLLCFRLAELSLAGSSPESSHSELTNATPPYPGSIQTSQPFTPGYETPC